jgi:YHS domain-containing protein
MNRNIRSIALMAALAVVLVIGIAAQQKSADTAIDPVCGMTVVKASAKATFDFKGTTYYFCSTGCKEAFAKEPEKYLKAQAAKAEGMPAAPAAAGQMSHMGGGMMMRQAQAPAPVPEGTPMFDCPMMAGGGMARQGMPMMRGRMGMMRGGAAMPGAGMMAPGLGQLFRLYGDKIEVVVENSKDGAALKVTSKDPEVAKAIQVHMAEHIAMMKKMKEAAKTTPAVTGVKAPGESACCAGCAMKK